MAKSRVTRLRGRTIVALVLLGFLAITTGVIWRRSHGIAQSRALQRLEERRSELLARQTTLETEIRDAASRSRLVPIVERALGMRVPADSLVIIIPRSPPGHDAPR